MNNQRYSRRPIGDILIANGVITEIQLHRALAEQRRTMAKLGETLISLGVATEEQITEARADQLDVGYVNLLENEITPDAMALIPQAIARAYKLVPIRKQDDRILVAMANPMDIEAIDLIQFETKTRVEVALATEWRITDTINRQYGSDSTDDLTQFMEEAVSNADVQTAMPDDLTEDSIDEVKRQSDTAPIIRMVNLLLTQGVRKKASDIHIEPRRERVDVRYRIDGELHLEKSIPKSLQSGVASRIKIMSELDIAERRLPQDGRISATIDGKKVDFRVSTTPSLYGERIVLRILHRSQSLIPLDKLGFSMRDMGTFESLITRPYGIILVTGPTGSGKTTTLYATLNMLKSEHTNIMTVEDPIEYELDGVNQTNVHPKIGLSFAMQLRAILRQDPDIVLLGEIRDGETADVAFRAALTGHLVLSTLHANDASNAMTRLIDMGVEPFLVSSAINGVTAQRLVRRLCPACKEPYQADDEIKRLFGYNIDEDITFYKAVGCAHCDNRGYSGRITIAEMLVMTDKIRRLTLDKAPAAEIQAAATSAGMLNMLQDGLQKARSGITTVEELRRKVLIESSALDLQSAPPTATI